MARRALLCSVIVTLGLLSGGCHWSKPADTKADLVVVTSTNVWGNIAATIAGPRADVTSFISSPAQDPHSFQPNARDVLAVSSADVVIENGGGYDDFMDQLLDASTSSPAVLNAVDISRLGPGADGTVNEHVWYDLAAVDTVADRMAKAFGVADPAHAQSYDANANAFTASVDGLRRQEAAMKNRLNGTPVGITEPVPVYMLDAIGAVNKTPEQFSSAVEEGEDVSVSVLHDTLRLYADHKVVALVYNQQTVGDLTAKVEDAAHGADIPFVAVTETLPPTLDYIAWMRSNLDHLDQVLSSP